MAAEVWTLDGLALNDASSFVLYAVDAPPAPKRPEWLVGADADGAALVRDPLVDNRQITLRIRIMPQTTMDLALAKIGAIVDKLEEAERQPDGLALVWTPQGATKTITFYVLSGEIDLSQISKRGDGSQWLLKAPIVTVHLTCKPYGYGAEVTGSIATSSNPVVTVTQASVTGDVPAEARLVVTDMASKDRRHVEWGLEWRHYNASTSLIIDSDDMVTTGFNGAQTTRTGAHDPNASGNNVVRMTLTAQPAAVCGVGNLTHVGTFRVKARVWAALLAGSLIRFAWRDGDGPLRGNPWATPPVISAFAEIDLGIITITDKKLGTQRWTGQIEAYNADIGSLSNITLDVDALWLIPAAEGYGLARGPVTNESPTAFSDRDEFDQTAGNLNAKTLPVGGTWATSGAATDLAVSGAGLVTRATTSDAGPRYAIAGSTNYAALAVQADVKVSAIPVVDDILVGIITRWVSSTDYAVAYITWSDNTWVGLRLDKYLGGIQTPIVTVPLPVASINTFYTLRVVINTAGLYTLWWAPQGQPLQLAASGLDADFATGATLDDGKPGLRDYNISATANTRTYDNFLAWVPASQAVIASGQSLEFRHDDPLREDSTGTYWGPPASYRGSRFLLPPAGDESRVSRVAVKARRNDVVSEQDDQIADSTKVEIFYTPRFLAVPR